MFLDVVLGRSHHNRFFSLPPTTMSTFRPSTAQDAGESYIPPWTASTDQSDDDPRPTTSAGRQQWSYESRPATQGQFQSQANYDDIDEEEEEYESSDDGDVFAYLPPNTAQQQQMQQQQHAQQHQQQHQQQHLMPSFAYNPDSPSAPTSAPYTLPSTTSLSTPYSPPEPATPSSAFNPYARFNPATAVSSPPDTSSTAPPFAYDIPQDRPQQYEAYHMTPLTSTPASREVHVSLPDPKDQHSQSTSADNSALRYRSDSKRTRGSSSGGSADLPQESASVKYVSNVCFIFSIFSILTFFSHRTDISISAGAPPYTPNSLLSTTNRHNPNETSYYAGAYAEEEQEDSPYPEVRASVSNIDDPDMPAMTFRMWFIGLLLCAIASAMNTFFSFRYPAPYVVPLVLL